MVVTRDLSSSGNVNIVYSRASGFTTKVDLESTLGKLKSGNAAMIHPDGQLYYTAYYTQDIYRYDFATKETTIAEQTCENKGKPAFGSSSQWQVCLYDASVLFW